MPNGKFSNEYVLNTRICQITVKFILKKLDRIYIIISNNGTIVTLNIYVIILYLVS